MSGMADTTDGTETSSERTTAPQGPYTMREVWIGLVITLVGVIIAFGIPFAITL